MTQNIARFIAHLESLRDNEDRAALARLRRGVDHPMGTPEMYPHVVRYLPEKTFADRYYFLVASLFAMHNDAPRVADESMGKAFAHIAVNSENTESAARRFTALLNAHEDDIGDHLRHAVSLSRSHGVGIDYARLLKDLLGWSHPDRYVQLRWARDFWGRTESLPEEHSPAGAAESPAAETTPE